MKVSVITVCYNSFKTIEETFLSVLSQRYSNYEYIVIDGASKDGTVDLIRKYEKTFNGKMKWISERDNGIYDAMNKGIRMASGDIISILNSDDVFADSNVLSTVVESFSLEKADIIYTDVYYFIGDQNNILRKWTGTPGNIKFGWIPCHPGVFVRKDVYLKKGLFDTGFSIAADYDFLLRIFLDEELKKVYLPICSVKMRWGGKSTQSFKNILRGNLEVFKALRKNRVRLPVIVYMLRLLRRISVLNKVLALDKNGG